MSKYHPHLITALEKLLATTSQEKEVNYFKTHIAKLISSYFNSLLEVIDTNQNIFDKLTNISVAAHEDDMIICQMFIDDWKQTDLLAGMRYNEILKKYNKISTIQRKKIIKEELDKQEDLIKKIAIRANRLANEWKIKLQSHTYYGPIARQLEWLSTVTPEELKRNYGIWEKEKL